MFVSVGSIIIDDLVLPDGQTRMGVLGGGGTHAAMGMRVWSQSVGIVAAIGLDFPGMLQTELGRAFDLRGLLERGVPTPRAWQLFEADGRRSEVFRTDFDEFLCISPQPKEYPSAFSGAHGVHLECGAPHPYLEWIHRLQEDGARPLVLWEPWDIFCRPENRPLFGQLAPLADVVSPNLREAQELTGLSDPRQIVSALLADGARAVALRMGESGSLVAAPGGPLVEIPAVRAERIVDVTGAGNAYCGGLLVGLAETGDLARAGRYAAVSASFALEQYGAMIPLQGLRQRAEDRLGQLVIQESLEW